MPDMIVVVFDEENEAQRVRESIAKGEKSGYISLDDSAVVVKNQDGKIHVKNEVDRGVKVGAVGGGLLGLAIGFLFGGPLGSLLVGTLGGALVGATADLGISKKFVNEVSESLQPGTSALFIIVRDSDPDKAVATLRPYQGTIHQTTLPPEAEETLRRALRKKG